MCDVGASSASRGTRIMLHCRLADVRVPVEGHGPVDDALSHDVECGRCGCNHGNEGWHMDCTCVQRYGARGQDVSDALDDVYDADGLVDSRDVAPPGSHRYGSRYRDGCVDGGCVHGTVAARREDSLDSRSLYGSSFGDGSSDTLDSRRSFGSSLEDDACHECGTCDGTVYDTGVGFLLCDMCRRTCCLKFRNRVSYDFD